MELDFEETQKEFERLKKEYEEVSKAKAEYDEVIKKAYADPELREPLKKIARKVAGLEIQDPVYEKYAKDEISKLQKELDTIKTEKETESKKSYAKQLETVLSQYGITGDEVKKFQEFVSGTGLVPTTISGWEIAARNYRRSLVAEPVFGKTKTFKESVTSEDYLKNPSQAFEKDFLNALATTKRK
jgi:DNA repair exonuclease SbcCD ATPase subunit